MLTSVLLPCWNALDLAKISLEQLMKRTTRAFELVIVDDGSSGETARWLRAWTRKAEARGAGGHLKDVKLLRNRSNLGYPISMNMAIAASRGERLLFANSDAAPAPGWLEEMSAQFDRREKLGGLSPCSNFPARDLRAPLWSFRPWYEDLDGMGRYAAAYAMRPETRSFIPAAGFVPGYWFMTTRSVLERAGRFDERYSPGGIEDWDLQFRIRRSGFDMGFAGRAFVHHVWSGIYRRNGLKGDVNYRRNKALFFADHPEAAGWPIRIEVPLLRRGLSGSDGP